MDGTIPEVTAAELKNIDGIFVIDRSGSMGEASLRLPGRTKYQELQEDVAAGAREFAKYDADGLTLVPFSSSATVVDGVKPETVANVFKEYEPRGSTDLAAALTQAIRKANDTKKDAVVFVYTDGSPNDPAAAKAIIEAAGKSLGRPKIGFTFVQVGNDPGAKAFLDELDTTLSVDVVATVSAEQAENLTIPQLAWLARNK